jgi:hypothetical protein
MVTFTIADLRADTIPPRPVPHPVYLVRNGEHVFYVGRSQADVIDHLRRHIGAGTWSWSDPGPLAKFIRDNMPAADAWQIELLTLEECAPLVHQYFPHEAVVIEHAAQAVMQAERPSLNTLGNPDPKPVPLDYVYPRHLVIPYADELATAFLGDPPAEADVEGGQEEPG